MSNRIRTLSVTFVSLLACLSIACDRRTASKSTPVTNPITSIEAPPAFDPDTAPTTAPTIAPLANAPTTHELATATAVSIEPSFMMIEQKRVSFPPAKLRVTDKSGRVVATLFSDDPKEAIDDTYSGNSFYFEMPLPDAPNISNFAVASWRQTTSLGDREDTPYGVFLNGHKQQLQPLDVKVDFQPMGSDVTIVWIVGRFAQSDVLEDGQQQSPREVSLAAKIVAKTNLK